MNPFIQKALNDVHSYPSASITPPSSSSSSSSPPSPPPESLNWQLARDPKSGGLLVDSHFRVQLNGSSPSSPSPNNGSSSPTTPPKPATMQNVFALGDVAVPHSGPLPATAQVANQSALWLARRLNAGDVGRGGGFSYKNLGIMTYLGNWKAIMQTGGNSEVTGYVVFFFLCLCLLGGMRANGWVCSFAAWLVWRGAYLTQTISWRNKLLIPIYWQVLHGKRWQACSNC